MFFLLKESISIAIKKNSIKYILLFITIFQRVVLSLLSLDSH